MPLFGRPPDEGDDPRHPLQRVEVTVSGPEVNGLRAADVTIDGRLVGLVRWNGTSLVSSGPGTPMLRIGEETARQDCAIWERLDALLRGEDVVVPPAPVMPKLDAVVYGVRRGVVGPAIQPDRVETKAA